MDINKRDFTVVEDGTTYELPNWGVIDGKGIELAVGCNCGPNDGCSDCGDEPRTTQIQFVRGSKLADEDVEKKEGVLHETLLSMMIHDLGFKNGLVPSDETAHVLQHLKEARMWMEERSRNRSKSGVQGTYKKH